MLFKYRAFFFVWNQRRFMCKISRFLWYIHYFWWQMSKTFKGGTDISKAKKSNRNNNIEHGCRWKQFESCHTSDTIFLLIWSLFTFYPHGFAFSIDDKDFGFRSVLFGLFACCPCTYSQLCISHTISHIHTIARGSWSLSFIRKIILFANWTSAQKKRWFPFSNFQKTLLNLLHDNW